jgi:hypothetical protein
MLIHRPPRRDCTTGPVAPVYTKHEQPEVPAYAEHGQTEVPA